MNPLAWPILVVGVLLQVKSAQSLRFLDERLLFGVGQLSPASTKSLTDLGVMHVRSDGRDLLALNLYTCRKKTICRRATTLLQL